jgi:mannose/cellobiose epimerase-like protein (N-acyl-D-glucosamine 2-epimerase family)
MTSSHVSSDRITDWLANQALPLWSHAGLDRQAGGFIETLTLDHRPNLDAAKRMRVQARQTYVYSHAHRLGWRPPRGGPTALEAAAHGFAFLTDHYWNDETGGFMFSATRNGEPVDRRTEAYEQAFALFASAWFYAASGEPTALDWARRIVGWLDVNLADPKHGGLRETPGGALPRRQNPHMHYLEALLTLYETTQDRAWLDRAAAIVGLFRTKFFDAGTGTLGEFFTADWRPAPGTEGRIVEPGHHFEWVWLLHKYSRLSGDDATTHAAHLYRFGETHGRDPEPGDGAGLGFDASLRDGSVHDGRKRLWVQTEAIKAQLARHEHAGDATAAANMEALVAAMFARYLALGHGSWYDHLDRDGRPFGDNAPASSFYHVFLALTEVLRVRGDLVPGIGGPVPR